MGNICASKGPRKGGIVNFELISLEEIQNFITLYSTKIYEMSTIM